MGRDVAPKTPFEVYRRCGYRQEQILATLRDAIEAKRPTPSCPEIMKALGMPIDAQGNLHRMIYALARRGVIKVERERGRLRITLAR